MKIMMTLKSLLLMLILISFLLAPPSSFAQDVKPYLGIWTGSISILDQEVEIIVEFKLDEDEKISGTLDVPIQGTSHDLTDINIEGNQISFIATNPSSPGIPTFKGELDQAGKRITGDFTQGDYEGTFVLEKE